MWFSSSSLVSGVVFRKNLELSSLKNRLDESVDGPTHQKQLRNYLRSIEAAERLADKNTKLSSVCFTLVSSVVLIFFARFECRFHLLHSLRV